MAFQFKGFRATKPVARLIGQDTYEVFFLVYHPEGKKPIRLSQGINSTAPGERKRVAENLALICWEALRDGWNPLKQKHPAWVKSSDTDTPLTFPQALDLAIELKKPHLSKYSLYDYNGCVRFMKKAAGHSGITDSNIRFVTRKDIRLLIATAKELNGWSSNARNKYLSILQALLSALVEEERLEYNPAHEIKAEPTEEGMGYTPASDDEKERIATCLLDNAPDFFDYIMFIYQSGIRRKELLLVQVKDINLARRQITIRPEVAKTNRGRVVPLPDDVYQILMNREIYSLPKDYYLFSSDKFKPGTSPYHPNTPTRWWKDLIIKGLGIDVKMYGMKHTGADDKIRAGLDLDVLKTLYGHRSKLMTENYAKAVKDQYETQIKNNSPAFAKVVQLRKVK